MFQFFSLPNFGQVQRRVKQAISVVLGGFNIAYIWAALSLINHPAISHFLASLQSTLSFSILSIPWLHFNAIGGWLNFPRWLLHPAQFISITFSLPVMFPWINAISSMTTPVSIGLTVLVSVVVTAIFVSLTTWLVTVNIPLAIAQIINQRRANRAKQLVAQLESIMAQLDVWELPSRDRAVLMPFAGSLSQLLT